VVKKIRVLNETTDTEETDVSTRELYEMAKSIDWKLWEMLQTMQRLEKKINLIDDE
jgi:predicted ATP-grasp superfamily ATP-dependent carboligase